MQITHLGHAAVLLQTDDTTVLIDPGNLSGAWTGLTGLDAVFVTHFHPDHLDPEQVPALLQANPEAKVYLEPSIVSMIEAGDVPELPGAQALPAGDQVQVGPWTVTAVGGQHAVIHADLPRAGNVGLVFTADGEPTFFHPGDAYDTAPDGVDVLALPAQAPWAALKETIDFARAVGAGQAFPIHEQLLKDAAVGMVIGRVQDMSDTEVVDLRDGEPHTF